LPNINTGACWNNNGNGIDWNGGLYNTQSATQVFNYEKTDINMDVTPLITSNTHDGYINLILKLDDGLEVNTERFGSLKFFSKDTHTIYIPKLTYYWNFLDSQPTNEIQTIDEIIISARNLKDYYTVGDKTKIYFTARNKNYQKSYNMLPYQSMQYNLPKETLFKISDVVTTETIVDYNYNNILYDTLGSYVLIDTSSLLPERYYEVQFKIEIDNQIKTIKNNFIFKIKR
jgi:hypothetical protein